MSDDEITRHRMSAEQWDHRLDLKIRGVRIGDTNKIRWRLVQDGDHEYDEQYAADVLEKVIHVIRNDDADTSAIPNGNKTIDELIDWLKNYAVHQNDGEERVTINGYGHLYVIVINGPHDCSP